MYRSLITSRDSRDVDRPESESNERRRISVADLRPSERNPRMISSAALASLKRSLETDPHSLNARPLLVNSYPGRESVVIAGNMRLRAAIELGWNELPAIVVSVPRDVVANSK